MSTKDPIGNGNAAMKEAAMQSLGAAVAVGAELRSSTRRTERVKHVTVSRYCQFCKKILKRKIHTRREPFKLNDRSSAKVGLGAWSLKVSGQNPMSRAVRAGSTAREWTDPRMQGQETLAGSGIVKVRASSTAGLRMDHLSPVPHGMRRRRSVAILSLF